MGPGGVFPAEMPDNSSKAIVPLDPDTAERLLSGRFDPDDAPPGYAEVATITGKRPGNVRVLAHRALRRLAAHLTHEAQIQGRV